MRRSSGGWKPAIIGAAVGLPLLAGMLVLTDRNPPSAVETERDRMLRLTREVPAEIRQRWVRPEGSECQDTGGTKCSILEVIAPDGCPRGLYVAISLLDDQERNIGWTNESAKGVLPGEPVRLEFDIYERSAATARVAEVSCR